ncbi:MAG TPA: hypothetical protein VKU41_16785 [Polyangiaceae bacterium]|nr:hypothetical protein [Polyangiaceae bacterium]
MATSAPPQSGALPRHDVGVDSAAGSAGSTARRVVPSWIGLGVLIAASALVFWAFDALPFQDLPAHAGLIALRHRFPHSPFEQRFFVVAPHLGPYSLFRMLGEFLIGPLGPVGAVRALATLPTIATPLALLWARRRLHGDRSLTAAYFGIALGFGFMTLLGFASYLLGVALLLVVLTTWLELMVAADRAEPARKQEVAVLLLAPLMLVAHGHAFVIFVALAFVTAVATGERRARLLRLRALGPALGLAALAAWRERMSVVPVGSVPSPNPVFSTHFQGLCDKLSLLITPTLITRTGLDAAVGLFVWGVIVTAVVVTARSLRRRTDDWPDDQDQASRSHSRALLVALVLIAITFLTLPHSIGWFGFVDGRLVPLLLLLGLMALRASALGPVIGPVLRIGAPLAACAMVGIALGASSLFQREAAGWREVLAAVPAEARLLNLPLQPNSVVFTAHPFVHYDKLALAERPTVVSDVWFHQGSGIYPTSENPALRLPATYSESDLRSVDWPAYDLRDWDYVLIRTRPEAPRPDVPGALSLAIHRGGWWLFRRQDTPAGGGA